MISVYTSIVLFCFQWLLKSYISKLLWTGFSLTSPTTLICYVCNNKCCWNQVQFAFAVPVSGLIPDLKRSDGSFPQASCQLSLVSPVNRELKRRVPVECSNRSKVEKPSVTLFTVPYFSVGLSRSRALCVTGCARPLGTFENQDAGH